LKNRHWEIKSYIDWEKFVSGIWKKKKVLLH